MKIRMNKEELERNFEIEQRKLNESPSINSQTIEFETETFLTSKNSILELRLSKDKNIYYTN